MIHIEKTDKVILPKKFHTLHNICVIIYDQLVDIIKNRRYRTLMSTSINLDNETREIIDKVNSEDIHILDFLAERGRTDEITTVIIKHLFTSILQDMASFIYESLSCAKKGKMSVAYTLLRKPLTDERLILEQLLVNRQEFIDRFYIKGVPKLYDPSSGNFETGKINDIIERATQKLGSIGSFFKELVFDFRYNKASASGLNGMMNHAHHIVTADKNYRTPDKNLNFVFSTKFDYIEYWNHYYYFIPYLLIYCASIADCLADLLVTVNVDFRNRRELKRYLALIFWEKEVHRESRNGSGLILRSFRKVMTVTCKCGEANRMSDGEFRLFFETDEFSCPKCSSNLLKSTDLAKRITSIFKQ